MSSGLNSVVSKYHVQPHNCMTVMSLQNPIIKWNRPLLVPKLLSTESKQRKLGSGLKQSECSFKNTAMYEIKPSWKCGIHVTSEIFVFFSWGSP